MFTGVCLSTGRGLVPGLVCLLPGGGWSGPRGCLLRKGLGVSAPRGVPGPGGALVPGAVPALGGSASGGCLLQGVSVPRGMAALGGVVPGCLVETPQRLLLWAVRILLECILVDVRFKLVTSCPFLSLPPSF